MKHFTIDAENNITVHASRKAARDAGAGVFSTEEQFADLIGPDGKRLVLIWNSLPGVKHVTKFANRKVATERIWKVVRELGAPTVAEPAPASGASEPATAPAEVPAAEPGPVEDQPSPTPDDSMAIVAAHASNNAPSEPETSTTAKNGSRESGKPVLVAAPAGSKTASVIDLLKRPGGASLKDIMDATEWQAHSVRGFISGTIGKKLGFSVESTKREDGQRVYAIHE